MLYYRYMVVVLILTLLFIASLTLRPVRSEFNYREVMRRKTKRQVVRSQQYRRLGTVFNLLQLGLLLATAITASHQLALWLAILYSLGLVLVRVLAGDWIGQLRISSWLYAKLEPKLLVLSIKLAKFSGWIKPDQSLPRVGSKPDLLAIVEASPGALADDDLERLQHGLSYAATSLDQIMIDWQAVETVDKDELLGPLRLDELHKTGYSQFPVLFKDDLIGLLDISHLVTLKNKRSLTAGSSMGQVFTVKADLGIDAALKEFSANSQTALVVTDSKKKPVGMLRLADTLAAVTGQNYK